MKNNYTYPVILDFNEKGFINIIFPDFEFSSTCVDYSQNFIESAQDFLALLIAGFEDENRKPPECSLTEIELRVNQKLVYVNIWLPYHKSKIREVYVKKTLTIPQWLNIIAMQNNINFSAILVKGLKDELRIF